MWRHQIWRLLLSIDYIVYCLPKQATNLNGMLTKNDGHVAWLAEAGLLLVGALRVAS